MSAAAPEPGGFGVLGLLGRTAWRSPARLWATLVALGCAAYGLGLAVLGQASVSHATDVGLARLGADLLVVPRTSTVPLQESLIGGLPVEMSLDADVLERIEKWPGVRLAAPQYFLSSSAESCCESGRLLLIGFDPSRDLTIGPWAGGERAKATAAPIWVGAKVERAAGEPLRLYDEVFHVAARLDETGLGYFDNAAFVPFAGVRRMEARAKQGKAAPFSVAWGRPSALLLRLEPGQDAALLARALEAELPSTRVVAPSRIIEERRARLGHLLDLGPSAVWILAGLATLLASAAQVLYWSARRASLGLFLALGARRRTLLFAFGGEALVLGLLGAGAGVAGAYATLALFAPWARVVLGLPMLPTTAPLTSGAFLLSLAGPIAWVVLGALVSVGVRTRQNPYALIRRER